MKKTYYFLGLMGLALLSACGNSKTTAEAGVGLKDVVAKDFLMGTALNVNQIRGLDSTSIAIVKQHFSAVVPENCMKNEEIHPKENEYNFSDPDKLVEFAQNNHITLTGHCLIWHSQVAPWFFVDKDGKQVSADVLKQRMKDHISTVVGRYKGKIKGWDVVNEAIMEDGSYRKSKNIKSNKS